MANIHVYHVRIPRATRIAREPSSIVVTYRSGKSGDKSAICQRVIGYVTRFSRRHVATHIAANDSLREFRTATRNPHYALFIATDISRRWERLARNFSLIATAHGWVYVAGTARKMPVKVYPDDRSPTTSPVVPRVAPRRDDNRFLMKRTSHSVVFLARSRRSSRARAIYRNNI